MLCGDMKLYFSVILSLVVFFSTQALRAAPEHAIKESEPEPDGRFDASAVTRLGSPYLQLPVFQHSRIPILDKERFSPAHGSGREQLPEDMREVLLPRASSRRRAREHGVNVVCQNKKMIVKVNKQVLGFGGLQSVLKLGTCDISKTTKHHHWFIYEVDQCATHRKLINNRVTYFNVLRYSPVVDLGPIRRAMSFSLPVECHFNRYHYAYKIGYIPQVRLEKHYKPLRTVDSFVLTPCDETWRRLSPTDEYTLGHPMYFQAEGPPLANNERLFVNSCFVTIGASPLSKPQFSVIENQGCMIDSMSSRRSRFIPSEQRNVVRFSLDAFLFRGMLGKNLYMHCEISIGSVNPTASAKSCTYNQSTKRWEELFGSNAVCLCCNSTCLSSDLSVPGKVITSEPWIMESDLNIAKKEQITPFLPEAVGTGFVQVITPVAEIGPRHLMPDSAEVVNLHRTFEEVFGLD